jgi:hypothetical protein
MLINGNRFNFCLKLGYNVLNVKTFYTRYIIHNLCMSICITKKIRWIETTSWVLQHSIVRSIRIYWMYSYMKCHETRPDESMWIIDLTMLCCRTHDVVSIHRIFFVIQIVMTLRLSKASKKGENSNQTGHSMKKYTYINCVLYILCKTFSHLIHCIPISNKN